MQFEKDMASEHRNLFVAARKFLLDTEGVIEIQKPRITTYSNSGGGICHLRTMPHGIDFGFLNGAKMLNENHRLTGSGKAMRVLSLGQFEPETIAYFLKQAIALNK